MLGLGGVGLFFRGRATPHRPMVQPERQEVVDGEHLMASTGSLFQVDQLPAPAGGPVGKQRGQDTSTESAPEEGMLEIEQRAQGAPFPPVHVGPSDSPETLGPRAGKSLTHNSNSKEGTRAHSASASLFAKWTHQLFSLSRAMRGWEWRVNATLTFTPSLKTQPGSTLPVLMALRPQTQPLLLLELGDVIALPVTQFSQL